MGDQYVLLRGGLIQNDPALPVLDLDVLTDDFPDVHTYEEVMRLMHEATALGLQAVVDEARTWLEAHPDLASPAARIGELVEGFEGAGLVYITPAEAKRGDELLLSRERPEVIAIIDSIEDVPNRARPNHPRKVVWRYADGACSQPMEADVGQILVNRPRR